MSSCNKYSACESRTLKNLKNINALKDKTLYAVCGITVKKGNEEEKRKLC
jgi:hypothetical protein